MKDALIVGKIGSFLSRETDLNAIALVTTAVFLALVAMYAPGGDVKWWGIGLFILIWLPMAHFGYRYYDELTVEKR